MIARAAMTFLALESIVYLATGIWLLNAESFSPLQAGATVAAAVVILRIVLSLPSFVLATAYRLKAHTRMDIGDTLTALVKDIWGKSLTYTLVQPFEKWLMAPDPSPVPGKAVPVLLVHGYICNRGVWRAMRRKLAQRIPNALFTISLEPPFARIDNYVPQLVARVEEICRGTGSQRIVIVTHSMGGLVARVYLARGGGTKRVAKLICIAAPNHGTEIARIGIGQNVRQMYYGNPWLRQLADEEKARPGGVPQTCIYTENDDLVFPAESSRLPGANNIPLNAVGHVSLLLSDRVADLVAEDIAAVGPGRANY
jgi:triacylglycerol lipase